MVSLANRTRRLRWLLGIRLGPGALILPKEIYKINMEFAYALGGHMGPRKFWRMVLPKLKYHNPNVLMHIQRHETPDKPAILTLFYRSPSASSSEPVNASEQSDASAVVKTVDMKGKHSDDIIAELVALTGATQVEETAADRALKEELRKIDEQIEAGKEHQAIINAERAKEQALLKAAQKKALAATAAAEQPKRGLRR